MSLTESIEKYCGIALGAVNLAGIAVDVVTVVELLKDVENLTLRTATRQRRTHQTRIEQREHALTSESALLVILVRPVAECRRRRASV